MHPLDALGEPVRRRILEVIGDTEMPAGAVSAALREELGLSQPTVSQHLKVLRDGGLLTMRAVGTSRLYRVNGEGLRRATAWLDHLSDPWQQPLDALETELARGKRQRRRGSPAQVPQRSADASG